MKNIRMINYLLFSGPVNSCKSSSIFTLAKGLCNDFDFKIIEKETIPKVKSNLDGDKKVKEDFFESMFTLKKEVKDFYCILEKDEIRILIYSPSDLVFHMKDLKRRISEDKKINIVISAIRDSSYSLRNDSLKILDIKPEKENVIEIDLPKIRNKKTFNYEEYSAEIYNLSINKLKDLPFNL